MFSNVIIIIFEFYYFTFDNLDFGLFFFSDDGGNPLSIPTNLFDGFGANINYSFNTSLSFSLAMLCTIITLILLLYMVYKICKLIICRIANV